MLRRGILLVEIGKDSEVTEIDTDLKLLEREYF
jgi:hypothetical protein